MLQFFGRRLNELHKDDRKGEKGFTLIELLVVVIIIGILAAIAIPTYLAQTNKARDAVVDSDARQAGTAVVTCLLEKAAASCDEDTAAELQAYGYNKSAKVTFTSAVAAGVITTTHTHADSASNVATFNSDTGQVN